MHSRNKTSMSLPQFKYHPDPIATGSFEALDFTCACCGELRSYVYVGPVYAEANLEAKICPWCIKSGLAKEMFEVEFTDIDAVGDYEAKADVAPEVKAEIAYQTPGFNGWQQERWLVHCEDAAEFLGPAGKDELRSYESQELIESLRADSGMGESDFRDYLDTMNKETGPTAYVFRCLHCGQFQGYSDFS